MCITFFDSGIYLLLRLFWLSLAFIYLFIFLLTRVAGENFRPFREEISGHLKDKRKNKVKIFQNGNDKIKFNRDSEAAASLGGT